MMKHLHWTQYLVSFSNSAACNFADVVTGVGDALSMERQAQWLTLPLEQHRNSISSFHHSFSPIRNSDSESNNIFSQSNNQSQFYPAWLQRATRTTSEFSGDCLPLTEDNNEFSIEHLPTQRWCTPCYADKSAHYVTTNGTSGCFSIPQICFRFSHWSLTQCARNLASSQSALPAPSHIQTPFSSPDPHKPVSSSSALASFFSHIFQVIKLVFQEQESPSGLVVNSHLLANLDEQFRPDLSNHETTLAKSNLSLFNYRRFASKVQDNAFLSKVSFCNSTTVNLVTSESFMPLYALVLGVEKMAFNLDNGSSAFGNSTDPYPFNDTMSTDGDQLKFLTLSFWLWSTVAFLMGIMSLLTTCGNMLVIISFIYDSKLRTVSNFYILNLAIADFLIGVFCIPLYMPSILWGEWRLGRTLCKMFLVVDNIVCSGSVLNIMLISSDRYLSVIHAMSYRVDQTPKKAVMKMLTVWIVAFTIYGPSTLFWEYFVGERIVGPNECLPEFYRNFPFTFSVAVIEFITPLASVSFINLKIYLNIKTRSEKMKEKSSLQHGGVHGEAAQILKERELRSLKRDKKAARALAVIVGAFSLSWAPYTVCNLIRTLWPALIGPTVFEVTFWLLWLNSTINPFLYPYCHPHFRQTFEELMVEKLGSVFCQQYAMRKRRQRLNPVVNTKPTPS